MRQSYNVVVFVVLLSCGPAAPEKLERSVTSDFAPDQIAVYSFILKSYQTLLKPTYRDMLAKTFYLEDETDPLDLKELNLGRGCLKKIDLEAVPKSKMPIVHRLFQQKWLPRYVKSASVVKCVDSTPSKSRICWQTEGALTLTEIRFDKSHTHALVGFGVGCGIQCGWGEIAILEKAAGRWRRQATCEEWCI